MKRKADARQKTSPAHTVTQSAALAPILEPYERARQALYADGIFPCDVGAAVLAFLADRANTERKIQTGTYLHRDLASYCRAVGEDFESARTELQPGRNEQEPVEECHTWLVIHAPDEEPILIDPNAELRGEPRAQKVSQTSDRYRPFPAGYEMIELNEDEDPEALARENWDLRLTEALTYLGASIETEESSGRSGQAKTRR